MGQRPRPASHGSGRCARSPARRSRSAARHWRQRRRADWAGKRRGMEEGLWRGRGYKRPDRCPRSPWSPPAADSPRSGPSTGRQCRARVPAWSQAKRVPVRPQPVITSSAMNSTPDNGGRSHAVRAGPQDRTSACPRSRGSAVRRSAAARSPVLACFSKASIVRCSCPLAGNGKAMDVDTRHRLIGGH